MKRLCTICARGGSKGITNKNIKVMIDRPLLAYSVEHAKAAGLFYGIAVSSDSQEILAAAREAGADLLVNRPSELATDTAGKIPAIVHCLIEAERHYALRFDTEVDLDATSPLRLPEDIVGAVRLLEAAGVTNVVTGTPARRSPYFNLVERMPNGAIVLSKRDGSKVLRRQDTPSCFDLNASVYAWRRDALIKDPRLFYEDTRLFEMPQDRSVDIDTELDWQIVEMLLRRRG